MVASILPELILAAGGMILLVLPRLKSARLLGLSTLACLAAALDFAGVELVQPSDQTGGSAFAGMLIQDRFGAFFRVALLVTMALVVLSVMGYAREHVRARREFYTLLLFVTAGLLLVVGAQHLALVYLGLETVSVLSYLLTGFEKRQYLAVEGALKYFLFGAVSTGAMLYGFSLLYGLTGTMELSALAARLPRLLAESPGLAWASLVLVMIGLGFKVALVPFHMWAPDAYEGAPTPVASFLSLGPKLAGFAVLVRVVWAGFGSVVDLWSALLGFLAVLTMTVGNVVALAQSNVKRLLAYSSIAHAGTMLIGLAVATPLGLSALLYYLIAYLLMNAGAFAGVIAVGNAAGPATEPAGRREEISAFSGLSRREPALAFLLTVCLLSLAGIPPLAGFFAKLWIFGAALESGAVGLAIVAAANSVVALFYYLKIIQAMYLAPAPVGAGDIPPARPLRLALALCVLGLFAIGLWQGPWLDLAARSVPLRADSAARGA